MHISAREHHKDGTMSVMEQGERLTSVEDGGGGMCGQCLFRRCACVKQESSGQSAYTS